MTAAPGLAALSVSSEPPGASVVIAGKLLGATPLRASVPAGRMTVLVLKAGYEPWSHDLALEAGAVQSLSARLASRASAAPEPAPSLSAPPPTVKAGDLVRELNSSEVATLVDFRRAAARAPDRARRWGTPRRRGSTPR